MRRSRPVRRLLTRHKLKGAYIMKPLIVAGLVLIMLMCCSVATGEESATIESFLYSYSGESMDAIRSYEIRMTARGYIADISIMAENTRLILSMTEEDVAALAGSLGDLSAWDGFSVYNPDILDGESFHLDVAYTDGAGVSAWGSNAFPEGYFNIKSAVDDFFCMLMEQYEIYEYFFN